MIKPIDGAALEAQRRSIEQVRSLLDAEYAASGRRRTALIETYGCQQNEADSDRMRGMLEQMGFAPAADRQQADLIVFNTCAVREHAELKAVSYTHLKKQVKPHKFYFLTWFFLLFLFF